MNSPALKICTLITLLAVLLSACGPTPTPAPTGGPSPTLAYTLPVIPTATSAPAAKFEKATCPMDKPSGVTVECGYLSVPEDRAQPGGKQIKLAVAVFKSKASSPAPDPLVYLEGGPGGSPLRAYMKNFGVYFSPLLEKRDLVMLDQRGTGYSQPALDCPELTQFSLDVLDKVLTADEEDAQSNQAVFACRDRLKAQGINLAAYTSAANAADLEDLRKALGYSQWNLYGVSYGTRLALTAMRDFPQGLRSVVLDSVYPLQANLFNEAPASAARAINLLFENCAADTDCNTAFPNLKTTFFDTVKRLNQKPAELAITLPDMGLPGKAGQQVKAVMSGDDLIGFTFQLLYATPIIPSLPQILSEAGKGNYTAIGLIQGQLMESSKFISRGMYISVECFEEIQFSNPAELSAALKAQPEFGGAFGSANGPFDMCKGWGSPVAPALENQAVKSDVPALVLAGSLDPVTPPAWAKLVAGTLSKSFYFEMPTAGHGASMSEACPRRLLLSFLDNPTGAPDASCIQKDMAKVDFVTPTASVKVELAPFESTQMGIKGIAPADWKSAGGLPGFYTPTGQATDQTQLLIQAGPLTADQFLTSLNKSLEAAGIKAVKSSQPARKAPTGLTYTFYEANAGLVFVDIALAESGGKLFIVLLQTTSGERDAFYKGVFLPVVDALQSTK